MPSINPGPATTVTANTTAAMVAPLVQPSVISRPKTVLNRFQSLISQALGSNAASAQPLIQPAAWLTTTAYAKGQASSNVGNNYVCIVPGTSAAGPTLTGNAAIVDGTAQWYYTGPAFTTSLLAPTFSNVIGASKYVGAYWTNSANTRNDGTSNFLDDSNFLVTGGPVSPTGTQNAWLGSTASTMFSVSFVTDAPQFQIETTGTGNPLFSIYVNGIPLTVGYGSLNTNAQSVNYAQLVFPTRTPRTFTVDIPSGAAFFGVLVNDTTSKVWAPFFPNSVRIAIIGTSYTAGSAQHPVTASLGLGPLIARLLGCNDFWIDGAGSGTGYLASATGGTFNSPARINSLIAYNPDIVVVTGGGINDRVVANAAVLESAAVLTYLTNVRAGLPNAIIMVIGSEAGATGPAANVFQMENAAAGAVAAFNDSLTFFIAQSSFNNAKAWLSGTGTTAAPNNSGSSDNYIGADGIHPVQAGCLFLANQSAIRILNIINTISL